MENLSMTAHPLKGKRILIIDDSAEIRTILKFFLKNLESETIEACDGMDALEKILLTPFDLVLMDIQMPRMDGFQLMDRITAMRFPSPVIAVTANISREDQLKYIKAGFTKFLGKPFDRKSLVQLVEESLGSPLQNAKATSH